MKAIDGLKEVGSFATSVGTMTAGVGTLAGEKDVAQVGQYLMLSGAATQMVGGLADTVVKMQEKGLNVMNPVDVVGYMVEKNVTNFQESLEKIGDKLAGNAETIETSMGQLFSSNDGGEEAQSFTSKVEKLGSLTEVGMAAAMHGVNQDLDNMEMAVQNSMRLFPGTEGASELHSQFKQVGLAAEHLQEFNSGKIESLDLSIIKSGRDAADSINQTLNSHFKANPESQDLVQAYRGGASKWQNIAVGQGYTFKNIKDLEKDTDSEDILGATIGKLSGGNLTQKRLRKSVSNVEEAVRLTQLYEGLPMNGSVLAKDGETEEQINKNLDAHKKYLTQVLKTEDSLLSEDARTRIKRVVDDVIPSVKTISPAEFIHQAGAAIRSYDSKHRTAMSKGHEKLASRGEKVACAGRGC